MLRSHSRVRAAASLSAALFAGALLAGACLPACAAAAGIAVVGVASVAISQEFIENANSAYLDVDADSAWVAVKNVMTSMTDSLVVDEQHRSARGKMVLEAEARIGEPLVLDGLTAGPHVVAVEMGNHWESPLVLGETDVTLELGKSRRATLRVTPPA